VRQEVKEEVIPIAVKRPRQKKNVEYEDQVRAYSMLRTSAAGEGEPVLLLWGTLSAIVVLQ